MALRNHQMSGVEASLLKFKEQISKLNEENTQLQTIQVNLERGTWALDIMKKRHSSTLQTDKPSAPQEKQRRFYEKAIDVLNTRISEYKNQIQLSCDSIKKRAGSLISAIENHVRIIRMGKYENHSLTKVEIAEIKGCLQAVLVLLAQVAPEKRPRALFVRALFEEHLGGNYKVTASAMYSSLEKQYPAYRRAFCYHVQLLFDLKHETECEQLLRRFKPTPTEIKDFSSAQLRALAYSLNDKRLPTVSRSDAVMWRKKGETPSIVGEKVVPESNEVPFKTVVRRGHQKKTEKPATLSPPISRRGFGAPY